MSIKIIDKSLPAIAVVSRVRHSPCVVVSQTKAVTVGASHTLAYKPTQISGHVESEQFGSALEIKNRFDTKYSHRTGRPKWVLRSAPPQIFVTDADLISFYLFFLLNFKSQDTMSSVKPELRHRLSRQDSIVG